MNTQSLSLPNFIFTSFYYYLYPWAYFVCMLDVLYNGHLLSTWQKYWYVLLILGYQRLQLTSWVSLCLLDHSLWGSQLPCLQDTQAAHRELMWQGNEVSSLQPESNWGLPITAWVWKCSNNYSPNSFITTSWKTLNHNQPVKLLPATDKLLQ